jgi:subtilisin family serine protease
VLLKPDLVGPDGTATSFFGGGNRFFGSSAAAPNVAAVGALMLQQDPNLKVLHRSLCAISGPACDMLSLAPPASLLLMRQDKPVLMACNHCARFALVHACAQYAF